MKLIKIIAVILLVATIGCAFMACVPDKDKDENGGVGEDATIPKPEGDPTEALGQIKVSFDVKNNTGENIYHVIDYTHKDLDLSVSGVLERYVKVTEGDSITFNNDGIESIDGHIAQKGQTWYILVGTQFKDQNGDVISSIQLAKALEIYRTYMGVDFEKIPTKDQDYYRLGMHLNITYAKISSKQTLKDGDSFTIILAGKPEVEEETN